MTNHHPIMQAVLQAGLPLAMQGQLAESMGGTILKLGGGAAELQFQAGEQFLQGGGVIQGGIVGAMLDFALAMAAFSRVEAGKSFATVSLTTHFLRPALPGAFIARARLDRLGSSMIFASGELFRKDSDAPTATATAVMAITRR